MSIVTNSNVPNMVLQLNAIQHQVYYRGMFRDIPDTYWKDEIGPRLYPLWDSDKDKLIVFTYYDNNTYHAQRRKFVKDFKKDEYIWRDYEMEVMDNNEAAKLYEFLKETFYLVDSIEKENFNKELANAYYDSKYISWYGIRLARNFLLEQSDWAFLPDSPLDDENKEWWKKYRQELRDIPQNNSFTEPYDVLFPISPEDWKQYHRSYFPEEEYLETPEQYLKLASHHLANMQERVFQHAMAKQSVMNPLNYKNYRDKLAELPAFTQPERNGEVMKQFMDGTEINSSDVLDYLIKVVEEEDENKELNQLIENVEEEIQVEEQDNA
jgi:hypothetical protein